jgi:hypothetical protein
MQTSQDGYCNHCALNPIGGKGFVVDAPGGDALANALVGTVLIVVSDIFLNDAL